MRFSLSSLALGVASALTLLGQPAAAQYAGRENIPVYCYGGKNQMGLAVCACDQGWISGMAALTLGNVRVSYGPTQLQACLQWADSMNGVGGATPPLGGGGSSRPPAKVEPPALFDPPADVVILPDDPPVASGGGQASIPPAACELIGVSSTDGTGSPSTYKTGGTEVPVSKDKLEPGTELVINMREGPLRYVTLHNRTGGGNWSTAYQGDRTRFPVSDPAVAGCLASSSCTHVIVSINGAHSRYESLKSSAYVQVCPANTTTGQPEDTSQSGATTDTASTTSAPTGPSTKLFDNWNQGPCSLTNISRFYLENPAQLTRLETWVNWLTMPNTSLPAVLTDDRGTRFQVRFDKGNCNPNQPNEWCYGVADLSNPMSGVTGQTLSAGKWFVYAQDTAMCWNTASGGTGYMKVYGSTATATPGRLTRDTPLPPLTLTPPPDLGMPGNRTGSGSR